MTAGFKVLLPYRVLREILIPLHDNTRVALRNQLPRPKRLCHGALRPRLDARIVRKFRGRPSLSVYAASFAHGKSRLLQFCACLSNESPALHYLLSFFLYAGSWRRAIAPRTVPRQQARRASLVPWPSRRI